MNHVAAFLLRMLREAALESDDVAAALHFGRAALNHEEVSHDART